MKKIILLFTFAFLLSELPVNCQTNSSATLSSYKKLYSNEFFISAGYNHCLYDFFDLGIRYYHWRNDGQTAMAFAGPALGCEFGFGQINPINIPYIGWQGQLLMLGYGIRAEYAMNSENRSFGFTPELGISLFEILRVTGGYRFVLDKNDPLAIQGLRFSVVAALPVSLFIKDKKP